MTMHKALNPRDDVYRLYVSRKEGGRGLAWIEDIGAIGTVTKRLLKGLEDLEVGRLLHYWERPEYWEGSYRLEETCCHSNSIEWPSAKADMKTLMSK